MSGISTARLAEERKNWRKDHPPDFYAKPMKKGDNSSNMMVWEAGVPGKEGTDWAGGVYKVQMNFPSDYPSKPPLCRFVPPLYHPNVYSDGRICLSILDPSKGWKPAITIKQMLLGIQDLLDNPNNSDAAQDKAYRDYKNNRAEYKRKVRAQAARNTPNI